MDELLIFGYRIEFGFLMVIRYSFKKDIKSDSNVTLCKQNGGRDSNSRNIIKTIE
jgi:hypothetical protein